MTPAAPPSGDVVYLSTLELPKAVLDAFASVSPRLRVHQVPSSSSADVPSELWRAVQVLHTNNVLPSLEAVPKLAWVQLDTAGVDHVTNHAIWTQTSVPITTIGGVSAPWTAEYAVMMLLAFSHRLPEMLRLQATRTWPSFQERWRLFLPAAVSGATVTVVGFGRIGRAIGARCTALGMHVIGVTRNLSPRGSRENNSSTRDPLELGTAASVSPREPGVGEVTVVGTQMLTEALSRSDYAVVALPLTDETRLLVGPEQINAMPRGAVLVNVSRGGIVDESALAEALSSGQLGGAAFDVFETEPLPESSPLWNVPGLLVSPHVSGFAGDYLDQIRTLVTENLRRFMAGEDLLNKASRKAGY